MVLFGASGDLSSRKIMPALEGLAVRGELPVSFAVVGVARTPYDDDGFRSFARESVAKHGGELAAGREEVWRSVTEGFRYVAGDYDDDATFARLVQVLEELDRSRGTGGNRLHYLAVPAHSFSTIVEGLGRHRLNTTTASGPDSFVRIVVEKPYGHDLRSALALDATVHEVFDESQVYRIDHFLGKETLQNVLALRFANEFFEPIWNRHHVEAVQVTVAETEGVAGRGSFYEQTGALRDMVQNHVMQILALTLMDPPVRMEPDCIRDEKVRALRAIVTPSTDDLARTVVAGRYVEGWVAGHLVPGYRGEPDVPGDGTAETFVAMRLLAQNWRWAEVPFFLRTGKRLPRLVTEVVVQFQPAPNPPVAPEKTQRLRPNALVLHIHPDEGVSLLFQSKVPGRGFDLRTVSMDFHYGSAFPEPRRGAYERLLLDALLGDPTLFLRADEVMQAWRIVDPILQAWASGHKHLAEYPAGTWGPAEAEALIQQDGQRWWPS